MEMRKGMMRELDREQRQIVTRLGFREGEQSDVARAFSTTAACDWSAWPRCVDACC